MAHNSDKRNQLIEILTENPLVTYACKKTGIGRNTFYRWMRSNPDFKKNVEKALTQGRDQWVDTAEAALMKAIKEGNLGAIRFFLTHNAQRYIPKRTVYVAPLDEKEIEKYQWAKRNQPIDDAHRENIIKAFKNFGLIKIEDSPPELDEK